MPKTKVQNSQGKSLSSWPCQKSSCYTGEGSEWWILQVQCPKLWLLCLRRILSHLNAVCAAHQTASSPCGPSKRPWHSTLQASEPGSVLSNKWEGRRVLSRGCRSCQLYACRLTWLLKDETIKCHSRMNSGQSDLCLGWTLLIYQTDQTIAWFFSCWNPLCSL